MFINDFLQESFKIAKKPTTKQQIAKGLQKTVNFKFLPNRKLDIFELYHFL